MMRRDRIQNPRGVTKPDEMKQPLLSLLLFVCIVGGRAFAPPVGVSNAVRPMPLVLLGVSMQMPENNEDKNKDINNNNKAEGSNNDGILTELGAKAGAVAIVAFIAVQGGSAAIHFGISFQHWVVSVSSTFSDMSLLVIIDGTTHNKNT